MQTSGDQRREIAKSYSVVITRLVRNCALGRVIQYSRDSSDRTDRPQRTGYPAYAGYDSSLLVIARSEATKQSIYPRAEEWIASLRSQ
jgi:hypothetical protein